MKPFDLLRQSRGAPPATPATAPAGELGGFSPDALLALGADGRIVEANAAALDLFGKPLEKLQGQTLDNLLDPAPESTGSNGKWEPHAPNGDAGATPGARANGSGRISGATRRAGRYDATVTRARGDARIVSIVTGPRRLAGDDGAATGVARSRSSRGRRRATGTCSRARTTRS